MIFKTMPMWYWLIVSGAFGAILGSFFNVLIVRMPQGLSLIRPPSHCPQCKNAIKWWQNIPMVSYLALGGKCSNCDVKIPAFYFFVEFLSSLIAILGCYLILSGWIDPKYALGFFILSLFTIPIFIIDIKHYLIPDALTYTGTAIAFVEGFIPGGKSPVEVLLGWSIAFGGFWLLGYITGKIVKKEALGFGDVKLLGMIGAFFGLQNTLFCIFFSALCGCTVFLILLIAGKFDRENPLPFGPFLCIGGLCAVLWGARFLDFYMSFIIQLIAKS